jgi:hypothetical protein
MLAIDEIAEAGRGGAIQFEFHQIAVLGPGRQFGLALLPGLGVNNAGWRRGLGLVDKLAWLGGQGQGRSQDQG